jgi:hypothetical protein
MGRNRTPKTIRRKDRMTTEITEDTANNKELLRLKTGYDQHASLSE